MTDVRSSPVTTELLPCPFCGGEPRIDDPVGRAAGFLVGVVCTGCGSQSPLTTMWNMRKGTDDLSEEGQENIQLRGQVMYLEAEVKETSIPAQCSAVSDEAARTSDPVAWRYKFPGEKWRYVEEQPGSYNTSIAEPLYAGDVAQPPAQSKAEWFCEWLQGYLTPITGQDELDAFDANTIRNTLNETMGPPAISSTTLCPSSSGVGGADEG